MRLTGGVRCREKVLVRPRWDRKRSARSTTAGPLMLVWNPTQPDLAAIRIIGLTSDEVYPPKTYLCQATSAATVSEDRPGAPIVAGVIIDRPLESALGLMPQRLSRSQPPYATITPTNVVWCWNKNRVVYRAYCVGFVSRASNAGR